MSVDRRTIILGVWNLGKPFHTDHSGWKLREADTLWKLSIAIVGGLLPLLSHAY
jgi:hypothetical protein